MSGGLAGAVVGHPELERQTVPRAGAVLVRVERGEVRIEREVHLGRHRDEGLEHALDLSRPPVEVLQHLPVDAERPGVAGEDELRLEVHEPPDADRDRVREHLVPVDGRGRPERAHGALEEVVPGERDARAVDHAEQSQRPPGVPGHVEDVERPAIPRDAAAIGESAVDADGMGEQARHVVAGRIRHDLREVLEDPRLRPLRLLEPRQPREMVVVVVARNHDVDCAEAGHSLQIVERMLDEAEVRRHVVPAQESVVEEGPPVVGHERVAVGHRAGLAQTWGRTWALGWSTECGQTGQTRFFRISPWSP